MPVRNGGTYLLHAVESVLSQSHSEFELLLIDDHSTDQQLEHLPQDSRIKLVKNCGIGLVDALNTGLRAARYDLIARMDADDIAHPDRLRLQLEYLANNPDIDICATTVEMFADQEVGGGYLEYELWINQLLSHADIEREFFIECPVPHPSAMFKRKILSKIGVYRDGDWPEDYDFWSRALIHGFKFGKPDTPPLLRWRDHNSRTSRQDQRYRKQAFIECKARNLEIYLRQRGIRSVRIWGTGPTGLKMHDALEARGLKIESFFDVNPKMRTRLKRGKTVHIVEPNSDEQFAPEECLEMSQIVLVAVSARGARREIRQYLCQQGWQESQHFLFVA